jgi:hypothetical protein
MFYGAMNALEIGRYAYESSAVNAAAQAGAEAALATCDAAHTPATVNCPKVTDAVTKAIQSTELGTGVTIDGSMTEGYYCLDTSHALKKVSSASSKPSSCSGVSNLASGAVPTLYLQVPVTYSFEALFPSLTIAKSFSTAIKRTAWMRMA